MEGKQHWRDKAQPSLIWLILILVPALTVLRFAFIEQLDALAFDWTLRVRGTQLPDERIVIVAIDDASLDEIGSWPWSPPVLEKLFSAILEAQPALLGVDILLPSLAQHPALKPPGRVVLATALGRSEADSESPLFWQIPDSLEHAAGAALGHIHADKDVDGVCRSIPLWVTLHGKRYWAFALEVARLFWKVESKDVRLRGDRLCIGDRSIPRLYNPIDQSVDSLGMLSSFDGDHLLINSRGGPRTFSYISAFELIEGNPLQSAGLRDKIVLAGATSYALGDHLATAFSGPSEMPGIEIHANALDTILNERFLVSTDELGTVFLLTLAVIMTWAAMAWGRTWPLAALLLALVGVVVLSIFLLLWYSQWIPMASLVIAVASTGGALQFGRISSLNRRLNQRFAELSRLLGRDLAGPQSGPGESGSYRSKSLEWKLEVLGEATDNALQLAQVKEEMLSFVTHELKTPLVSILGFSELLLKPGVLADDERQESLRLIHEEASRLGGLADDYLKLARLEQDASGIQFENCDLVAVVAEACRLIQPQLAQQDMTLKSPSNRASPVLLRGNQGLLIQVLVNLLENAIKYSPPFTRITLEVIEAADSVTVLVRDQGFGIAEQDLSRLFGKFYRGTLPEGQTRTGRLMSE